MLVVCCVGSALIDLLIYCSEESYRVCLCVCVCVCVWVGVCVCVCVIYRPQKQGHLDHILTVATQKEWNTQVTGYSKLEYFSTVCRGVLCHYFTRLQIQNSEEQNI